MKDKEGRYYISPLDSEINAYLLYAENHIPLHWFILFNDEERKFLYSHSGFGAIHYEGIYYDTKINLSLERLKEADAIIRKTVQGHEKSKLKLPIFHKLNEIQAEIVKLQTWLSGFDSSGYVLLNYGEICSFIHPYTMQNECSVKEIEQVLTLISKDQIDEAQSVLNVINQKWEDIRRKASGDIVKFTIQ